MIGPAGGAAFARAAGTIGVDVARRNLVRGLGVWCALVVVWALPALARGGPALEPAPGVESGELANGVRYVVVERDVTRGAVWLEIQAGSMDEPAGQNGVAELARRVSLRAPAHFEVGEAERLFRPTEVQSGRSAHGATSYDRTWFMLGLAGRGAGLDEALLFCADVLGEPAWDDELVERERAGLAERSRLTDRTLVRVQDEVLSRVAPGCAAIGHWPGGTPDQIGALGAEDVRAFRRAWYTPGNATVIVVTAEPAGAVAQRVAEALGGIPARASADRARSQAELDGAPGVSVVLEDRLARASVGVVRLGEAGAPVRDAEGLRRVLLDKAIAESMARRLEQSRRERRLPGAAVNAEVQTIFSDLRVVQAGADGSGEDTLGMVRGVHREVARAVESGTDPVVQQASWRRIRDTYDERARTRDASEIAWWFAARAGAGDALVGPETFAREAGRLALETSAAAFDRRVGELFSGDGVMTIVQTPIAVGEDAVRRAIEQGRADLDADRAVAVDASGLFEHAGAGGSVEELSRHAATGVTSAWLSGGIRVVHMPTDAVPGRVTVRLVMAGGALDERDATRGLSAAGVGALRALAVRGVPAAAVSRALDERGLTLDAGGEVDSMHVTIEGPGGALGDMLGVVRAVLSGPAVEPGAVEAWRDQFEIVRSRAEREAYHALRDEVRRAWLPNEPRLMPLTREQADAVDAAGVQAWLDRHASAPAAVVIVGDVSWHGALDAAARALGALEQRPRIGRPAPGGLESAPRPRADVRREVTLGQAEGAAAIAWGFGAPSLDEIDRARALVAGAEILSERLKGELEGVADGAVAVWASYTSDDAFDRFASVQAVIVADAEHADDLIARAESIAIELSVDGPTPEEMDAFRAGADEIVSRSMRDPAYLAAKLGEVDLRGRSLDDLASMGDDYATISARVIRDEFREALTDRPRLTVIVRPGRD